MFDRKRPGTFFLTLLLIFVPSAAAVAGTVQGQIRYENLAIQSALVAIAGQQALTAGDGRYSIEAVPAGTRTITVTAGGYRTERRQIEVPATGVVTQDFQLNLDLLFADQVVVTGTYSPRTKRESSVAITTVNDQQIAARQPRNTADLLRVVPGFYVESSGGEVGNNLWARGLPADGSYRYVALMEDGMPVYDATELFFVNADIFLRVDENIAEMEAVRGGNSALFGSNAPGGVVNFISKVGAQEAATTLKFTAGTDGLARVGFQHGGPLTERWTYNIGGFYRYDQGVRDPGFPASEGGQLKLNLTRQLDRGYLRVYGKYLNDSNIFYLPLPFQAGGDFVQGFPLDGTLATPEANFLRVPLPNQQGTLELPLQDGQRQNGFWIMGEIFLDLPGGWSLQNMARGMSVDHQWNALVPFDMVRPETFAGDFVPAGGSFRYSFVNHDQPFSAPNDLLLVAGLWHVEKPMSSFSDQLQFTRRIEAAGARHSVALGGYFSHYRADNTWYFTNILTDEIGKAHV